MVGAENLQKPEPQGEHTEDADNDQRGDDESATQAGSFFRGRVKTHSGYQACAGPAAAVLA